MSEVDEAAYVAKIEASFRGFMLRFRRDFGRPLTEQEHALAKVAHCSGWVDGADCAFAIAEEGEQP